jgi:DNA helicase INO80
MQRRNRKSKEPRSTTETTKENVQQATADETLVESSDLEDCQELWTTELGNYVLETNERQSQVAQYFWSSVLVCILPPC